jgi:hypothetical protein
MATKAEKKQRKMQALVQKNQDVLDGKIWPPHVKQFYIIPREAFKGRIRCNLKEWEPILDKFPLVHSVQYKKDKLGKCALIRHSYFLDEDHIPKLIFKEFRHFFNAVGFNLLEITPTPFGYEAYGEEIKND